MSRNPSPRRLKHSTASIKARPGNATSHHLPVEMKRAPSAPIIPHSCGGARPPPRPPQHTPPPPRRRRPHAKEKKEKPGGVENGPAEIERHLHRHRRQDI